METKILATALLTGHIIAVCIMALVLKRQIRIIRDNPDPEFGAARRALLTLSLATLGGNIVPIIVDTGVIADRILRHSPTGPGIAYSLSNVFTLICSAGAVLALYKIAEALAHKSSNK